MIAPKQRDAQRNGRSPHPPSSVNARSSEHFSCCQIQDRINHGLMLRLEDLLRRLDEQELLIFELNDRLTVMESRSSGGYDV